jgi:GxxExxY protein
MPEQYLHKELTETIIKAFYKVYNTLGFGFLEKVYENALSIELLEMGLNVERQKHLKVYYGKHLVGDYYPDLVVEDVVIVELKAMDTISPSCEAQLLNYLRATVIEVGLLLNFGIKPEIKRRIFTNDRKALRP